MRVVKCKFCDKEFECKSKQIFCSVRCKNRKHNTNCYVNQQTRGESRKRELIRLSGGGCKICGYNRCIASLSFHHREPKLKEFQLDARSLSNRSMDVILKEFEKC